MKCKDCSKAITEEEATTFIQIDKWNMIVDYASALCQICRIKRHEKLGIKLSL